MPLSVITPSNIIFGALSFIGRTSNIASTAVVTAPVPGVYHARIYAVVTSALGSIITSTIGWTDTVQAQTDPATLAVTLGSFLSDSEGVVVNSGNITIKTTGYTSGTYSLWIWVTR